MDRIPMNKAVEAVIGYLSSEVAKVTSMKDKFLMFAALGAVKANPSSLVDAYSPMLKAVGIVDADGMVCITSLKASLDMAFANVPTFQALGFTFTKEDAAELVRRLGA